mmetsp:Transcript_16389/g.39306  ORF Transcript_16389/g.39306 Transcript_16389/m.39306 type:complete len:301 (-) Transcript_16389:2168-3070(-)
MGARLRRLSEHDTPLSLLLGALLVFPLLVDLDQRHHHDALAQLERRVLGHQHRRPLIPGVDPECARSAAIKAVLACDHTRETGPEVPGKVALAEDRLHEGRCRSRVATLQWELHGRWHPVFWPDWIESPLNVTADDAGGRERIRLARAPRAEGADVGKVCTRAEVDGVVSSVDLEVECFILGHQPAERVVERGARFHNMQRYEILELERRPSAPGEREEGFVALDHKRHEATLDRITVDPGWKLRGQGTARDVLKEPQPSQLIVSVCASDQHVGVGHHLEVRLRADSATPHVHATAAQCH